MSNKSSIIRIFSVNGEVIGSGFLIAERWAITCAHVITLAFGTDDVMYKKVNLDFPLSQSHIQVSGKIIYWKPNKDDGSGDVAVLKLDDPLPMDVEIAELVETNNLNGHKSEMFGFTNGHKDGVWVGGKIKDRTATGWIQIDIIDSAYKVDFGFSGSPVLDKELNDAIVGMIVRKESNPNIPAAFMLPIVMLSNTCPKIKFLPKSRPKLPLPQFSDNVGLAQYKLKLVYYNFENNAERYDCSLKGGESMQRRNAIELLLLLKKLIKNKNLWPDSWLDVGCGTGLIPVVSNHPKNQQCCKWLLRSGIRAGFDLASNMIDIAKKVTSYTKVFRGDLLTIKPEILRQQIGQPNVDLVIANNVIHWLFTLDNIDIAFRNIHEILVERGIFAATIAAEGTANTFLRAYKTVMEKEMENSISPNDINLWSSHLSNPIGLQKISDMIEYAKKNNFRVEIAEYIYEPFEYDWPDIYVEDARAYGDYLFMAPLLSCKNEEERKKIWNKIKNNFKTNYFEKFNQSNYIHDQYMIYLIVSRED